MLKTIVWPVNGSIWSIMAQYLQSSGYTNISDFYDAMNTANPQVYSWRFVTPGTIIALATK